MRSMPPKDARHIEVATGWLELGNYSEANEELEEIEAHLRGHPAVLNVRWRIYALAGKWDVAVELATVLMKMDPNQRAETAYALAVAGCRLKRCEEARQWLQMALEAGGDRLKLRALQDQELDGIWLGG